MSINKGQTRQDHETAGTLRVFVVVEPWESWLAAECVIKATDYTERRTITHSVEPVGSGAFLLRFDRTSEVKEVFESGNAEIQVIDRNGQPLGATRIAQYRGSSPIALKVRIVRPAIDRVPMRITRPSNAIITDTTVHQLARRLAALQGVGIREARAPRGIVQAVGELNRIAEVAAYSRTGDKIAEGSLRSILSPSAFTSPGGGGRGFGGRGGAGVDIDATMLDALGELPAESRCGSALSRATRVLDSAFILDLEERNADAKWIRQAQSYVGNRMRDVSTYAGSVERASRGTGRPGGEFPPGGDDFTTPLLPPDRGGDDLIPPDDPLGEGFGPDLCAQITELCLALYAEVLAAQMRDDYTDLIAEVKPNCLCSTYDPNQTFIALPKLGRRFPVPWPIGVSLVFGAKKIDPNDINFDQDKIEFKIPANARTGPVFLQALGMPLSRASQNLARNCALAVPEIPSVILFDRSPAALISIIYPPVIDSLTSDVGQQPAEACTPVEIRWHAHLWDQPVLAPIHPCGSIDAILRDGQGNPIAAGGASGSVVETRADTTAYTLEAVSRAGALQCGTAVPISLTIVRVKYVRLDRPAATGMEHQGGTNGQLLVRISCPAPAGGQQVDLTSSDPAVLQVPSPVTIPERANSLLVDFATTAACTAAPIQVTAASAGHTEAGSLEYDIYTVPVLQWAAGPQADVQEGGPFSSEVKASCVPDNTNRVNWWLIRTDPNNQQPPIALRARRTSGQYPALRFGVQLGTAPGQTAPGLIPGNWELVVEIPDRANLRSKGLAFVVVPRPKFAMTLSSPTERTVVWDVEADYTLVATGENIPPNVNAPVVITTPGLPAAFEVTASSVTLTQANSGQPQNSTLRLVSRPARGPVGAFRFSISASASGVQSPPAIPAILTVKHKEGAFKPVKMLYDSSSCSTVNATVGGNGMIRTVTFAIPTPNRTINTQALPAIFYAISPNCRVGVVIPPVGPGTGPAAVDLRNLGFEPGTGGRAALGDSIDNFSQIFWQRFWFSPDDTLLVIIGRQPRGIGTTTHFASLHDMITGLRHDRKTFSPAIVQTAEDPSPLLPPAWMTATAYAVDDRVTHSALTYRCTVAHTSGVFATDLADGKWEAEFLGDTEIELAVITGIVLVNRSNGDVVEVHFTNQQAAAGSLELHLL